MRNHTLLANFGALVAKEKQADKPNVFRIRSYQKVIKIISEFGSEITSTEQVKGIPGIGAKTLDKIALILENGGLEGLVLETAQSDDSKTAQDEPRLLEGVTGIGPVKSKKLVEQGWTLKTLRNRFLEDPESLSEVLTHHQRLGIKYYEDLKNRIPYQEIEEIERFLQKRLDWVNQKHFSPGEYQFKICGSYRRNAQTSGDIDVLFYNTKKSGLDESFLGRLLMRLKSLGFIKDSLTDKNITTKYMGFCKLSDKDHCRRIDMRCIASDSLPCALLYFTGSGEFNKNMRTFALKKGYSLNEYGIFKLNKDKSKGAEIAVDTEEDVFKVLGKEYVAPENRLSTVRF